MPLSHSERTLVSCAQSIPLAPHAPPYVGFVPRSRSYQRAVEQVERYARYDHATVLLQGESGTGKTYFARRLHEISSRARAPFCHVNLAALDDNLASSDLFGHLSGAFTGAREHRRGAFVAAEGGTLFLDEVGHASRGVQAKLLHAVEYGEVQPLGGDRAVRVNARLVVATNAPLPSLVAEGRFLPDLLARVAGLRVVIPALRDRREDIPGLVNYFVATHAPRCGYDSELPRVDRDLMAALAAAAWPYNVRQLDATVRRLMIEADGAPTLTLELYHGDCDYVIVPTPHVSSVTVDQAITAEGSKAAAARRLGVSRSTLYRRLKRDDEGGADDRGGAWPA